MKQFNFHVKPIGLLDMLHFKKMVPRRAKMLAEGSPESVTAIYPVNRLAELLHPKEQSVTIQNIIGHGEIAKTYILSGKSLAPFRAGQYLSMKLTIGDSKLTRPYSISSSPQWVKEGKYAITVKRAKEGFASDWILDNWTVGTQLTVSGPEGNFYYEPLRDAKHVVGVAGGSGITPFLSMAYAIRDGLEDFSLTILYGSCLEQDILFKEELEGIAANCDRVKIIHVLSDEQLDGYECGLITADLIKKNCCDDISLFLCGPAAMYHFVGKQMNELSLEDKFVRREVMAAPASPVGQEGFTGKANQAYQLTVIRFGETLVVPMRSDETVLVSLERAGIESPAHCRSGECGWCRSRLVSGEVFIPADLEARRKADLQAGYIHPCCTYPLTDLKMEIWP